LELLLRRYVTRKRKKGGGLPLSVTSQLACFIPEERETFNLSQNGTLEIMAQSDGAGDYNLALFCRIQSGLGVIYM
jgi:hypothetical protein